jgi:type II secretory pathway pseudopilin PulG
MAFARQRHPEGGYAMVALLVGMAVMAIVMSAAMPVWRTAAVRDREAELIFRGNQYGRAIALFQRKYAGAFPPSIDVLVNEHFLRKRYKDPITGEDFQLVGPGTPIPGQGPPTQPGAARPGAAGGATSDLESLRHQTGTMTQAAAGLGGAPAGGIMGVASKSTAKSLALYNGRDKYNEWVFVGTQASTRAGTGAAGGRPGGPGSGAPGAPRGGSPPGTRGGAGAGVGGGAGGPSRSGPGLPTRPTR